MRKFAITLLLLCVSAAVRAQVAQSPAFTYQGQLRQAGAPVDGVRDLAFALFDSASGGTQVGATLDAPDWPVVDGQFTIDLAFPGAFAGEQRWLEVRVEGVPLLPREPITAAPVAQFALVGAPGPPGPPGPAGLQGFPGSVPAVTCGPGDALREIGEGGFTFACHTSGLHSWSRPNVDVTLPGTRTHTLVVRCPEDAVATSGGVEHVERGGGGTPRYTTLRILESFPTFRDGRWGWQLGLYNTGGVATQLRAFAVCTGR